jgi:ATP-dependent Clp protease ATP-binding subunit ClpA
MGFSPQAERVMKRAEDEARRFGQRAICSEHLLLALLCERFGPAAQAADAYGDREAIQSELRGILATTPIKADNKTKRRMISDWALRREEHMAQKRRRT